MISTRSILFGAFLMGAMHAAARSGPDISCDHCAERGHFSAPASGLWHNPDRPGSGMVVDVQNGVLLGSLYAYTPSGGAQWYVFNGPLTSVDGDVHALRVTATLQRFEGGTCVNCPYTAATAIEDAGQIALEFTQRNHGSYSIAGGEPQYIVPFVAGIETSRDFPDPPYEFPTLTGQWVFVVDNPAVLGKWGTVSTVYELTEKAVRRDERGDVFLTMYLLIEYDGTGPGAEAPGRLQCMADYNAALELDPPNCELSLAYAYPGTPGRSRIDFPLNYANVGANRIEARDAATGITIRAFRIDYD